MRENSQESFELDRLHGVALPERKKHWNKESGVRVEPFRSISRSVDVEVESLSLLEASGFRAHHPS